jgi:hypothetical protein
MLLFQKGPRIEGKATSSPIMQLYEARRFSSRAPRQMH